LTRRSVGRSLSLSASLSLSLFLSVSLSRPRAGAFLSVELALQPPCLRVVPVGEGGGQGGGCGLGALGGATSDGCAVVGARARFEVPSMGASAACVGIVCKHTSRRASVHLPWGRARAVFLKVLDGPWGLDRNLWRVVYRGTSLKENATP